MKKVVSLFKNDPYGIKYKLFKWKLERHIKEGIKVHTKSLAALLNIANKIGIPRTDEDTELMRKVIKTYDDIVLQLEKNLKYARMCISEENTENNGRAEL